MSVDDTSLLLGFLCGMFWTLGMLALNLLADKYIHRRWRK